MPYVIRPLMLGKMLMNCALMTYMINFEKDLWSPVVSWYIRADDRHVLIDTGAPADMIRRYWYREYEEIVTFEAALQSVGITPDDVNIVIQTHLHFDHCGNTPKCKNADVIVQADELRFSRNPHPLFYGSYMKEPFFAGVHFREVEGDVEVLPGIRVIKLPGHSPGTQGIAVQTDVGTAVLSGFCAIRENFSPPEKTRKVWPVLTPGVHTDSFQAFASAMRVKEIADIIIPTHDMESATKKQIP